MGEERRPKMLGLTGTPVQVVEAHVPNCRTGRARALPVRISERPVATGVPSGLESEPPKVGGARLILEDQESVVGGRPFQRIPSVRDVVPGVALDAVGKRADAF